MIVASGALMMLGFLLLYGSLRYGALRQAFIEPNWTLGLAGPYLLVLLTLPLRRSRPLAYVMATAMGLGRRHLVRAGAVLGLIASTSTRSSSG